MRAKGEEKLSSNNGYGNLPRGKDKISEEKEERSRWNKF